jgi:hypothetical protein
MLIAVINQSTLVSNDQVNTACQAIQIQMTSHVFPAWNLAGGTIKFFSDKTQVPNGAWLVSMLDNPTQAGALGYHAEDNDVIDAFIFAGPVMQSGGVALYDATNPQNVSVSSVLSHEVCEMIGDQFASFWAEGPSIVAQDGETYSEYALELSDAVEGNSYAIDLGNNNLVSVSNFVLPSWFNKEATAANAPFDYLGKLTAPFTMTEGGYMIVRQGNDVQQVFGDKVLPQKKLDVAAEWYRR